MSIKQKLRYIKYSRISKEEKILREIFPNIKISYFGEHIIDFNYLDELLFQYEDTKNIIVYDIVFMCKIFNSYDDNINTDNIITPDELSMIIKRLMDEYLNIKNINVLYF